MQFFVYIVVNGIQVLLSAEMLLMAARAVVSWITFDEDSPLNRFLFSVTEPFVLPVRLFLERFQFFSESPIDLSFMVAMILLFILQAILPDVHI